MIRMRRVTLAMRDSHTTTRAMATMRQSLGLAF
jgi:hypothetical protein